MLANRAFRAELAFQLVDGTEFIIDSYGASTHDEATAELEVNISRAERLPFVKKPLTTWDASEWEIVVNNSTFELSSQYYDAGKAGPSGHRLKAWISGARYGNCKTFNSLKAGYWIGESALEAENPCSSSPSTHGSPPLSSPPSLPPSPPPPPASLLPDSCFSQGGVFNRCGVVLDDGDCQCDTLWYVSAFIYIFLKIIF